MEEHPNQKLNIGIFEPGTVSIASGLSLSGMIPTIYGISPFYCTTFLRTIEIKLCLSECRGILLPLVLRMIF